MSIGISKYVNLVVNGQKMDYTPQYNNAIVAGSISYLQCRFSFTDDWGTGTKTAQFYGDEIEYNSDGKRKTEAKEKTVTKGADGYWYCDVPYELILPPRFHVSVYDKKSGLITTNLITVAVNQSGYSSAAGAVQPTPPPEATRHVYTPNGAGAIEVIRQDPATGVLMGGEGGADKPLAVPLVHDQNGVRTLTNVASAFYNDYVATPRTIQIVIPRPSGNPSFSIFLSGNNFVSASPWELRLACRLSTASNTWYAGDLYATFIGKTKIFEKIRYGYMGNDFCILLTATFRYPMVMIDKVLGSSTEIKATGWSINLLATEDGITNIVETPVNWVATDDGVWHDMVLQNGFEAGVTGILRYRKIGNVVYVNGSAKHNTGVTPLNTVIATLPIGFRPERNAYKIMFTSEISAGVGGYARISVGSNGNITITYTDNQAALNITGLTDFSFIAA